MKRKRGYSILVKRLALLSVLAALSAGNVSPALAADDVTTSSETVAAEENDSTADSTVKNGGGSIGW